MGKRVSLMLQSSASSTNNSSVVRKKVWQPGQVDMEVAAWDAELDQELARMGIDVDSLVDVDDDHFSGIGCSQAGDYNPKQNLGSDVNISLQFFLGGACT
jgi:hypothetical protein